ncbi:SDR family oxidoreductase [Mesorhizobium sp. RSR380A]|uniref:SDR family oxidoreductase n=1 Tax=Mesorhizobium sp. LNJC380A00 TaxID=1287264 RepID=UPI000413B300|nr:SDR family oxidoreductase [Mesorhizobium sp. LNJC380A00]
MTGSIWAMPFFAGKTVVITGGTTGIGNGIAMAFAEAGAIVHATGATAAEVAAARAYGTAVSYSVLDVRDMTAVEGYSSQFTSVAALVNCAGVNLRAAEFTVQGFETVVDINLTGSMRSASAFRGALSNGGAIVNIASMFAFFGAAHAPAYAASKGAIVQLTKSLAIAYAGDGIRVNALAPGWIETAMTAAPRADPARNAELMKRTPMGRWGTPGDLTGPALFLCSPLAGFITGAILPVDGGYLIA